ncbi:MAG: nitroreductase [Deltaproteobacteria bacterium]|nr:MAG: nitroreductase [Deltaproteobacteria bacterium]
MDLFKLVESSRSFRRFDESVPISKMDMVDLVKLARICPSAANQQPMKYFISDEAELNGKIFETLAWASYLRDWPGPAEGERPTGYIVICADTSITKSWWCDDGIVAQTMLLGATEKGFGGCMIGAIKHKELHELLNFPDKYEIRLVLALGKPAEVVKLESADGSIRYWRDGDDVHHVPKRPLDEVLIKIRKKAKPVMRKNLFD